MFGREWDEARATIVDKRVKKSWSGNESVLFEFVADVRPTDGPMFRTTLQIPTIATDFWEPWPGDVVNVLVERESRKVKFDKADPALSQRAQLKKNKEDVARLAAQPPGTPADGPNPFGGQVIDARNQPELHDQVLAALTAQGIDAVPPSGATRPSTGSDPIDQLTKLAKLREQGILTDAEFEAQKKRVLGES